MERKLPSSKTRSRSWGAENARFNQALEFYANRNNWSEGHKYRDADEAIIYQEEDSSVAVDKGSVALKTLSGE